MARILIIDDDDQFLEILRKMLSRAGYEVLVASDGRKGVELYRKEQPDVVITDVIMPEKEGAEVIFELQKEFPDIKIIAMSGGGEVKAEDYLKSITSLSNVKHTFEKPFAMAEMLQVVKELVNQ